MKTDSSAYIKAYDSLNLESISIREEIERLETQINVYQEKLSEIHSAMNALKPFTGLSVVGFNKSNKGSDLKISLNTWKEKAVEILEASPNRTYTTIDLLDLIVGDNSKLDKAVRKKHIANLSLALAKLVSSKAINSKPNPNGRGYIYYAIPDVFFEALNNHLDDTNNTGGIILGDKNLNVRF